MAEVTKKVSTTEETQDVLTIQNEGGVVKQREDVPMDGNAEVTEQEDRAEELDLSSDNPNEEERAARPDQTQGIGTNRKLTTPDEK